MPPKKRVPAKTLAAKGYMYQFVFSRNAGHVDPATLSQTLGSALQWVWRGFRQGEADGIQPVVPQGSRH